MMLFCEDHRVAVEAVPTVMDADVLEGLTVADDEHMDCELSDPNWEDSNYDRDIDFG